MARGLGMEENDLGLRFSEEMSRHYRGCVTGAASEPDGTASEPDVVEEVTLEAEGSALEIRGVTSASGVWVNLNDLLDKIAAATASEPERARLRQRRPFKPVAIRRRKRQTR